MERKESSGGALPGQQTNQEGSTRERLVEHAIEVFGSHGFEATTTRMVVQRAGTQLTAISYYFTNKEGLYQAAAEHIAAGINEAFSPDMRRIETALTSEPTRPALIDLACDVLDGMAKRLVGPEIPDNWSRFLSREMAEPTGSFPVLFQAFDSIGKCLSEIIGRILGKRAESPDVVLTMLTLVGQVLVFRSDRAAALSFMGWEKIGNKEVRAVRRIVRRNVQRMLAADPSD